MARSVGKSRHEHGGYRWDGRKRGTAEFAVLQVTLGGCGRVEHAGGPSAVPIGRAMLVFIPDTHVYTVDREAGYWEFAYAVVHGRELLRLLRRAADRRRVIPWFSAGGEEQALYELFRALDDTTRGSPPSPYEVSSRVYTLAMAILDAQQANAAATVDSTIVRAREYLQTHLAEDISVEDLADRIGLSRHHFSRRFAAAFGLPPVRYLREIRLRRASELLATGDLGVEEVAYRSGFSSASYFCRVFREGTGLTPTEFRRSRS